ncbi:hypothetical protein EV359DRAFT_80375 [Lentinula novae-zelandiae]|nr:hypothetical protein EV359DRAFT_80375 [Lentinula novae-zelandiae]
MGPPRIDTVALLLREKDQEILQLKLQLKAYAARTSLIQSRLTSTQDALDALQLSHDEELRAEQAAKHKMQQQLKTYYQFLRSVNYEKEDLRNVIVSFLRRVEDPHNTWPQSQLHVSSLLEPADPKLLMRRNQDVSNDFDQKLMNYAAAMIDALVHERDLARTAHQSLLSDTKAQIASLGAELARRDLELEKCISHCVDCPEFQGGTGFEPFTPMEPSVLSKILQKTSTRHKILELGNQQLEGQLENLRQNISVPLASTSQIKCSDRIQHEETSREIQDDSDPVRMSPKNGDVAPSLGNVNPTSKLIAQMDTDIRNLGLTINAFASERDRLQKMVTEQAVIQKSVSAPAGSEIESRRSVHLFQDNASVDQRDMEVAYAASLCREKSLIEDNLKLVGRLRDLHSSKVPDSDTKAKEDLRPLTRSASSAPPQLIDAEDGEVSMDLATPLLPTTFIATEKPRRTNTPGTPSTPRPLIPLSPALVSSSLFGQERSPSSPCQGQSSIPSEDMKSVEPLIQPSTEDVGNEIASKLASGEQQVVQSAGVVNRTELVLDSETNLND